MSVDIDYIAGRRPDTISHRRLKKRKSPVESCSPTNHLSENFQAYSSTTSHPRARAHPVRMSARALRTCAGASSLTHSWRMMTYLQDASFGKHTQVRSCRNVPYDVVVELTPKSPQKGASTAQTGRQEPSRVSWIIYTCCLPRRSCQREQRGNEVVSP